MKYSIVLLLLPIILAVLSVSATASVPNAICFRKTIKCCYRFRQCGYIVKKKEVTKRCDYKHCKKECRRHCRRDCKPVHKTVPHQKCEFKPVRVCKKVRVERRRKWVWEEKCRYERKRHCRTFYKRITREVCRPVCEHKCRHRCYNVKAVCRYYRIFHFPKFCPYLRCDRPTFEGPSATPRPVISKRGTFVRATKPIRTDVDRRKH